MNWFKEYKITAILAGVNPIAFIVGCAMLGFMAGFMGGDIEAMSNLGGALGVLWTFTLFFGTIIWGFVSLIIGMCGNWSPIKQWVVWATVSFAGFIFLTIIGLML